MSSRVVATVLALGLRRTTAAAARRIRSAETVFLSPRPTSSAPLTPSLPAGTASVSSAFPSKPASVMKASSDPPVAASSALPPGPRTRPEKTGTARTSAATLAGAADDRVAVIGMSGAPSLGGQEGTEKTAACQAAVNIFSVSS